VKFPMKHWEYMNNYTLDLHNAQFGKIKYIDEVMSVYRKHSGGIWSMVSRKRTLISQLPTYKFYLGYFDKKYKDYFFRHLKNLTKELIYLDISTNDKDDIFRHFLDYCRYNLYDLKELIKMPLMLIKSFKIVFINSGKHASEKDDLATN
jgi:hypothetical protein